MIANQLVTCEACRDASCKACKAFIRRQRASKARKVQADIARSLGMTAVKGAVSGRTYYE